METSERQVGHPEVKGPKSFREIVLNFTDSREVLREAISNSLDWGATTIRITVYEDAKRADKELVIQIWDNGQGLTKERLSAFWNLSDTPGLQTDKFGRKLGERVGEKGHGAKTYWKCRAIQVESVAREEDGSDWHVLAEMIEPINTLMQDTVPNYYYTEGPGQGKESFTEITIRGYHTITKEDFRHEILKDYIQWFTKLGSIELELGIKMHSEKVLHLQGLGLSEPEQISFGHTFPQLANNMQQLQKEYQDSWPRYYVNKWIFPSESVEGYPTSKIDVVFYLEGDSAKRQHNLMLARPGRATERWHYTVSDRYGLYVCKDWIPLSPSQRVSEWVAEKSEWTLYHSFVNCQDFELTANRASIGNTDHLFVLKVREAVERLFKTRIKASPEYQAYSDEVEFTKQRGTMERTEEDEKSDLQRRHYHAKKKRTATYRPPQRPTVVLVEPRQEAEVLILFSVMSALKPDLFPFKIIDYSTSRGIDALCVLDPTQSGLEPGNLRYVEFKRVLTHEFGDHTFVRLTAIVCWECNLENGATVHDLAGQERTLRISKTTEDETVYMLFAPPHLPLPPIKVYVLKDYLNEKLKISFRTRLA